MKKYELIDSGIAGLRRIRALRDFGDVKAGAIGGYISGEHNLSHEGDCWVYDNARVSGDIEIRGSVVLTRDPIFIKVAPFDILVTDKHVAIGCRRYQLSYWLKYYEEIGNNYGLPQDKLEIYKNLLYTITHLPGIEEQL